MASVSTATRRLAGSVDSAQQPGKVACRAKCPFSIDTHQVDAARFTRSRSRASAVHIGAPVGVSGQRLLIERSSGRRERIASSNRNSSARCPCGCSASSDRTIFKNSASSLLTSLHRRRTPQPPPHRHDRWYPFHDTAFEVDGRGLLLLRSCDPRAWAPESRSSSTQEWWVRRRPTTNAVFSSSATNRRIGQSSVRGLRAPAPMTRRFASPAAHSKGRPALPRISGQQIV
jgi:hypothetical protein